MIPLVSGDPLDTEPVRVYVAGFTAVLTAGLALAATFDWVPLDAAQAAALIGFVTVTAVTTSELLRARVFSPATVRAAGVISAP